MKLYFASDVHLGAPTIIDHRTHEKRFVDWLDAIKNDADEIYLLGDIFDYWFEYTTVVPKGFVRFLAKLCEITEKGIKVHLFTGNHDVWMWDYLPTECGVVIHKQPISFEADGKHFFIGHGDGLGHYDRGYNLLKWIFNWRVAQVCYSWLHPDLGGFIARIWSGSSRKHNAKVKKFHTFRSEDEHQVMFARSYLAQGNKIDYFIFGHRHVKADYELEANGARLLVLGEWMQNSTYAVFCDGKLELKEFYDTKKGDAI